MRVHVLTNLFPPCVEGGYEILARDVATALQERGHTVTVVTSMPDREVPNEPGIERVLRLSRRFGSTPKRDRARHFVAAIHNRAEMARLFLTKGVPDAVLVMSLRRLGTEPLRAYAARNVPHVLTVNDDWPVAYVPNLRGSRLACLDSGPLARHTWDGIEPGRVVWLSEAIRQQVLAEGAPLGAGRVCAQGVPLKHFERRPFRAIPAAPRLLWTGRVHPVKAPEIAIDTLASLRRRGVEATLDIAGRPVDEAFGEKLRRHAADLGVAQFINWLGFVSRDELPAVYARADVFLFPSHWEGEAQGLTYLEAMAVGVPVIAFPLGGARQLLDADPGAAVRPLVCTGDAFADAVQELQSHPNEQRRMVGAASVLVRTSASLDRYVDVLESELVHANQLAHPKLQEEAS